MFGMHIPSAPAEDPVGVLRGSSNDRRGGGVERLLDVLRVESDLQPALATVDEYQIFRMYSLIVTAKLNDIDPRAWLADVLARIADHPVKRLDELSPWKWRDAHLAQAAA